MTQTAQPQPLPHESEMLLEMRGQFELVRALWRAGIGVKIEIVLGTDGADVVCATTQRRRVKFRQ